jgi:predicted CoA-substrate-specific enzyme activase
MADYYGGCDIGSATGKAIILDAAGEIVARVIIDREIDPEETAIMALDKACSEVVGLDGYTSLAYTIGTGYGRHEVPAANENVSEITCHALGAHHCNNGIRTVIDIGGQDAKAIAMNDNGTVREFALNDKCAAGTGRFFEAMSRTFRMSLETFSALSLGARKPIPVTAQCSVFAETEVISLLAKKHAPEEVAAGIQSAVAKRVFSLARRVGVQPQVTLTGGCAKNAGLVKAIENVLREKVVPLSIDPQLIGALGAAILARKKSVSVD